MPQKKKAKKTPLAAAKAKIKVLQAKILELEDEIHAQYLLNRSAIQRRAWN